MNKNRILIIPDAVLGDASGAVVTQVVRDAFREMGHEVGIFSPDITCDENIDGVAYFNAMPYTGFANFKSACYLSQCLHVYDSFQPDVVLTLGSVTNKPVCYVQEALNRGYKVSVFIFMQDFFCSKIYANDSEGPCTKCLDKGYMEAYKNKCGVRTKIGWLRLTQRVFTRRMWQKALPKVNHVATTTQEQLSFYERFGIEKDKHCVLYLPFASKKLEGLIPERGDYFIGIAQDRVEKGFQFIPQILKYTRCKVILAYSSQEKVDRVKQDESLKPFFQSGQLDVIVSSWKGNLGEMIAKSCGVIIPSIWPTTTEYGWLEAMALSKPVCCFDISVHHEFIQQGGNGYIAPLQDYAYFGSNMDAVVMLSDSEYDQLSKASRALFDKLTDTDTLNNQLSALLI